MTTALRRAALQLALLLLTWSEGTAQVGTPPVGVFVDGHSCDVAWGSLPGALRRSVQVELGSFDEGWQLVPVAGSAAHARVHIQIGSCEQPVAVVLRVTGVRGERTRRFSLSQVDPSIRTRTLALLIAGEIAHDTPEAAGDVNDVYPETREPRSDLATTATNEPGANQIRDRADDLHAPEPAPSMAWAFSIGVLGELFAPVGQSVLVGPRVRFTWRANRHAPWAATLDVGASFGGQTDRLGDVSVTLLEAALDLERELPIDAIDMAVAVRARSGWAFVSASPVHDHIIVEEVATPWLAAEGAIRVRAVAAERTALFADLAGGWAVRGVRANAPGREVFSLDGVLLSLRLGIEVDL